MKQPQAGSMMPGSDEREITEAMERFGGAAETSIREIHRRWKKIMAEVRSPKKWK
jgi:hypothetical protein